MTTEKTKEQIENKAGEAAPEAQQPAKEAPKETPKVETKTDKETPKPEEGKPKEPRRAQLKEEDDDIPADADLLELSPTALKARLRRATKSELKKRFGSDDYDDIKAKLDRLTTLEAQEEERKRNQMSENEKLQADLAKANQRAERAERRAQAVYDERVIAQEENRIVKLAEEAGMDPEYIEDQFPKLARHLNENYKDRELKKLKDGVIKKWFEDRIKAKPKLAREAVQTSSEPSEKERPKVGLTNGAPNKAPTPKDGQQIQNKTMKPGQPNSMTRAEAKAEAKKLGYSY